jgi:hypothetical protein
MRVNFPLPSRFTEETIFPYLHTLAFPDLTGWTIDSDLHAEIPERDEESEPLTDVEYAMLSSHVAGFTYAPTWTAVRLERAPLLDAADKRINTLDDNGQPTTIERAYRQALRDVTKQADPENPVWPIRPW